MMGARNLGVRLSILMPNRAGEIAKVSKVLFENGGNILSLGTFTGESPSNYLITFKVEGIEQEKLRSLITPLVVELLDIRTC
jgi:acetoin utilization protein AcuB